jgi:putative Mg2+ transporter-C (MgtC) family protein
MAAQTVDRRRFFFGRLWNDAERMFMGIDYPEIVFRLLFAILIGSAIGLDRNLRGNPTGVRTLALVAFGSALVTMASMDFASSRTDYDLSAVSRTIQGVITGIGFLGAGVIIHDQSAERVHGLTTAASVWVTAALGIVCGIGSWQIAMIATVLVLILIVVGRPLEKMLHQHWLAKSEEERAAISRHEE